MAKGSARLTLISACRLKTLLPSLRIEKKKLAPPLKRHSPFIFSPLLLYKLGAAAPLYELESLHPYLLPILPR